ncbi:MAG: DUF4397 domain-containing protein, partial [Caldilineaceae bacterium]
MHRRLKQGSNVLPAMASPLGCGALLAGALLATLVFAAPARAQEPVQAAPSAVLTGTLSLAHDAPFASSVVSTAVDVAIDGTRVLTGVVYGDVAANLPVAAGDRLIEVFEPAALSPVLSSSVAVVSGQETAVSVIGGANGWPIASFSRPAQTPPAGKALLVVRHLAPFAAGASAEVDICLERPDLPPIVSLSRATYAAEFGVILQPSAVFTLSVALPDTDCATALLTLPPFRLGAGGVAEVTVLGLNSGAFPLATRSEGMQARLTVAHLASFANTPAGTAVSVELSGTTVLTDFVFGEVAGPLTLPGLGSYPVSIVPSGTVTPAISGT